MATEVIENYKILSDYRHMARSQVAEVTDAAADPDFLKCAKKVSSDIAPTVINGFPVRYHASLEMLLERNAAMPPPTPPPPIRRDPLVNELGVSDEDFERLVAGALLKACASVALSTGRDGGRMTGMTTQYFRSDVNWMLSFIHRLAAIVPKSI
jgi:hypothetical protein